MEPIPIRVDDPGAQHGDPSSTIPISVDDHRAQHGGYLPIENYGLIGNMETCALVGTDGSIDFMCWPKFDSPSVFCRLLDKNKGGYFSIRPAPKQPAPEQPAPEQPAPDTACTTKQESCTTTKEPPSKEPCTTKQQYLPSCNILQTSYIYKYGVVDLVDFFPRPKKATVIDPKKATVIAPPKNKKAKEEEELKRWLVRRVNCTRGKMTLDVEIFPAFGYALEPYTTEIHATPGGESKTVTFHGKNISMQLDVTIGKCRSDGDDDDKDGEDDIKDKDMDPIVVFTTNKYPSNPPNPPSDPPNPPSEGVVAHFTVAEGQAVSFVLRNINNPVPSNITTDVLKEQQDGTQAFWSGWIARSTYKGRWREAVSRSLMILKLMTYEPTGAIVASPTFSLPEWLGGGRNWDYRYSWVRDSSFTVYILLRLGFSEEAHAYMNFIFDRLAERGPGGNLPIMFSIDGSAHVPEDELCGLEGYRGSKPVRIGNGAALQVQLDIYGELMDAIYLYNKYGRPVTWDQWLSVRSLLDYVLTVYTKPDMSIWEVRGDAQSFVYSKIMLWVAFDRGLRLAEKRNLPCPNRAGWLAARDALCEEVMEKGYNKDLRCFVQSYESRTVLDSSILIAPLVFFISPNDPRFLNTMDRILRSPEKSDKGGLTSADLVYRYDTNKINDGVGGDEGAFTMCTFWLVEAMTRAGVYKPEYLAKATRLFENMLSYGNHLSMFSEEISTSGKQLGNTPQAFSHLALISAAYNLNRVGDFVR